MGYEKIEDLYAKVQCTNVLKDIDIPLLLISSRDDPVIPSDQLPKDLILDNNRLLSVQTQRGGHIEFFTSYKAIRVLNVVMYA